ncbi:MAG: ornithine cyclodeaminase family protein [Planctomycetota bacterium]|nr:ornithine cyclodeaminase family protein [Planctomycetota bacterium]MDA1214535.1 ornithine cyclodeaminase family protein [Planctomycetota bacterium]
MPVLYLTENDVRELIDMSAAIELVEEAFGQLAEQRATNTPRQRVIQSGIMLHTMSAGSSEWGVVGWKNYTTTPTSAKFHVALYDAATGTLQALIEADTLGRLRTGAASGVATEYMARSDARLVGIFGAGKQAETQLEAVCAVRKIEHVTVHSRNPEKRDDFADRMSEKLGVTIEGVSSPFQAAGEKDIIITATSSKTPVFDGNDLDEGTHLNIVGSNFWQKAEIDVATVRRSDVIVCDNKVQCQIEAGDFRQALEEGAIDWKLMHELSDIVAERQTGRANADQITLFKSVGLAIEDLALGQEILKRARAQGKGRELEM